MSGLSKLVKGISLACTVALVACSTPNTFTTQVSAFNNWSTVSKGQLYAFAKDNSQSLEQKSYENLIAQEMWRTGLMQTHDVKKAQFLIDFNTQTETREKMVQEYYDEPVLMPRIGFGFGNFGWGWHNTFFSGFDVGYIPRVANYPVQYHRYVLSLEIKNKAGNPVYQAQTFADSRQAPLSEVMPYLVSAVFDSFPSSGVHQVEFDIDKSQKQNRPVKYVEKE